jgi:two-component SAPR family response regulator
MLGTDLAQQIRRTNPNAKILYLTAFTDRLFAEKRRLWQDEAIETPVELDGFLELCLSCSSTIPKARKHQRRNRVRHR